MTTLSAAERRRLVDEYGERAVLDFEFAAASIDVEMLLDGIRDEVRQAVIEGDAQDCSSPDCIADAVYEVVRVRLRDVVQPAAPETD